MTSTKGVPFAYRPENVRLWDEPDAGLIPCRCGADESSCRGGRIEVSICLKDQLVTAVDGSMTTMSEPEGCDRCEHRPDRPHDVGHS